MKSKASTFVKQIISVITTIVKAKSMAIKSKTSAMKTRLIIFSLLKNKKMLMGAISNKLHALLGQQEKNENDNEDNNNKQGGGEEGVEDENKALVLYSTMQSETSPCTQILPMVGYYEDDDDKYPDLTHCLFDTDDEDLGDQNESVIDVVRHSKEDHGEDFSLEDEIDQVADLFIKRFHRQMKMQKLASFKRYQEMLQRSV